MVIKKGRIALYEAILILKKNETIDIQLGNIYAKNIGYVLKTIY